MTWYMVHGYLAVCGYLVWCLGLWPSVGLPDSVCAYLTWYMAT